MPLAGTAFLALWNDIAPAREVEYEQWHTLEHVPERVAVEGFLIARRYVDRTRREHRFFTLYELDSIDVLDSHEYRDLVEHPTPSSASMRPDFANVVRATCRVETSSGTGIGGAIACLCLPDTVPHASVEAALRRVPDIPGVTGIHVGRCVKAGMGATLGTRSSARAFDIVMLVEALDRVVARDALDAARRVLPLAVPDDFGAATYGIAFVFPGGDPAERARHRRPAWGQQEDRRDQ